MVVVVVVVVVVTVMGTMVTTMATIDPYFQLQLPSPTLPIHHHRAVITITFGAPAISISIQ